MNAQQHRTIIGTGTNGRLGAAVIRRLGECVQTLVGIGDLLDDDLPTLLGAASLSGSERSVSWARSIIEGLMPTHFSTTCQQTGGEVAAQSGQVMARVHNVFRSVILDQAAGGSGAASGWRGERGTAADALSPCGAHPGAECVPWPTGDTDEYTLFTEGDDLYDAMVAAIGTARRRVDMECYIYAADEVGWRIGEALAARARAGVQVRLMVDAAGSMFSFSRTLEGYLRKHGVAVRRFHRWSWRQPFRFYRRNHRKLLVIDGREAFVGGFNIHRESSRSAYGPGRWRDTHVRLSGALAERASALFASFWDGERGEDPPSGRPSGDALVPNHSRICRHQVHCLYARLLGSAKRRLFVTTPYFVPDRRTQHQLVHAARGGVDVRLLLPGKSDVPMARWAARAAYQALLSAGIRVFEYQPRMLHAKTAVADGVVATVGTANLDYRSFFVNYELNLFSANRALCAALEEQFRTDLDDAVEITAAGWSRRPWRGMATESIGWIARRWL